MAVSVRGLEPSPGGKTFSVPDLELKVLDFWEKNKIFQKSLAATAKGPPYVFYDGPPFATGLPHHGHLVASTIKDVVPRYWTMKGFHVDRRFGWDCHGLPIEYEIDKLHGLSARDVVADMGITKYSEECRKIVLRYTSQWRKTISRLGRWVDFDRDYKTMDPWYMESVWWVFRQLWDKGLIYKDVKVVPLSTALGTVLSNFEAGSHFQQVEDPAITVLFHLRDEDAWLPAWTTTPWTLPSNLAVCVGPDIDYVQVRDPERGILLYIAADRLSAYDRSGSFETIRRVKGSSLVGRPYEPMFPYFGRLADEGLFRVLGDAYVTSDSGSGLVHQAPAFGEDDLRILRAAGSNALVCPVDMHGRFTSEVPDFAGQYVKDADPHIISWIKERGFLYREERIRHSYPFCYRSDTPLIYRTIDSWYVNVTRIKDRLIAANQAVRWVPEHVQEGRFGNWLCNAKDWALSRSRIWGTPVPLWVNDVSGAIVCIGSRAELEARTGVQVSDLHREFVDDLNFRMEGEEGLYRRVPEVLDCWFESGSMPYAQLHYPFENQEAFKVGFPAQFITEGLDQTRGWFYTLMVLSTALYDRPAFENVIVSGMVMAGDGKKMSKRLRNYTAPDELMETYGADALRLYLISSNLMRGEEQRFVDSGVREMSRRVLLPWYNANKFLSTYAMLDAWSSGTDPEDGCGMLDRWILSETQSLLLSISEEMAAYRLYKVIPNLFAFIENLTNWYIRLSRSRFWGEHMTPDKSGAYATLFRVMRDLAAIMAPFAPFMAETLYLELLRLDRTEGAPESVHLCSYPVADKKLIAPSLERAVRRMQQVVLLGRRKRESVGIGIRMPLRSLTVIHKDRELLAEISQLEGVIRRELNVKEIRYESAESAYISLFAKPNFPVLGKRLGRRMRELQAEIQALSSAHLESFLEDGRIELAGEVFGLDEIQVLRAAKPGTGCLTDRFVSIVLDCTLDDELIAEGRAREVVHHLQRARKSAGLGVSDRICLRYDGEDALLTAIETHRAYIAGEALALEMERTVLDHTPEVFREQIAGMDLRFAIHVLPHRIQH